MRREASIIVLDEPTAVMRGRTAVFISHRLSSARFCDRIAALDGGRLV